MITRRALLVGTAAGTVGGPLLLADEPSSQAKLRDALMAIEKSSWEMGKQEDVAGQRDLYPDDVVLILGDGARLGKADLLKADPDPRLLDYSFGEPVDIVAFSPDLATLIFPVTVTSSVNGGEPETARMLASSTYLRRDGKWWNVLYQETPVK